MDHNYTSSLSKHVIELLRKELDPYAIILFGSFAHGLPRKDSDIDIAFLSEEQVSEKRLFVTAQCIAERIGRDVDLIDLNGASTVLQAQVIGKGTVIYLGNELKFAQFGVRALKEYAFLNEERAIVFESIAKRGRIYG